MPPPNTETCPGFGTWFFFMCISWSYHMKIYHDTSIFAPSIRFLSQTHCSEGSRNNWGKSVKTVKFQQISRDTVSYSILVYASP